MSPEQILATAKRWNTVAWMETSGKIADPGGDIVTPTCNEFQVEVSDIIKWCHDNNRPARIIILKPRRRGSSTVSVAAGYRRLQAKRATGCIAGGSHYQNQKLFKMLDIYAKHDTTDPGTCTVLSDIARFSNGSEMDRLTLANPQAGRAGGYQFLVITEMAFLDEEGVADAASVVSGLIKTVQFFPDTIIILESTANGASGDYYDRWNNGITFDEFKAGRNGFVRVFYPWFAFADLIMEDPASEGIGSWDDITDEEAELAAKHDLSLNQIAWMRWSIREECNDDFDKFSEDYPFDAESAFRKSGRGRFSQKGLDHQVAVAKKHPPDYGVLEYNPVSDSVIWRPTPQSEARFVRFEQPKPGKAYIGSCDPATGDSQTSGKDPDSNAAGILRRGYIDANSGTWIEPALVMRNIFYKDGVRFGNWVDTDILEEEIWLMCRYYGSCMSITETNKDRGIIELQKKRGDIPIYQREVFNKRDQEKVKQYGWNTTEQTREMIVSTLARAIRESGKGQVGDGIEVRCPWIIAELKNFVTKKNGRSEAAKGKHDDCFVAGTRILTPSGEVGIETLKVGDLVMTRDGPKRILATRSRIKQVVSNLGLVGTSDHPIITPSGEKGLSIVSDSDTLYMWKPSQQSVEKRSFTEAKSITDTLCRNADTSVFIFGDMILGSSRLSRFIGKSGLIAMEKFQKATRSIISTATRSTTRLETWKRCLSGTIQRCTPPNPSKSDSCGKLEPVRRNGSCLTLLSGGKITREKPRWHIKRMASGSPRESSNPSQSGERTTQRRLKRCIHLPQRSPFLLLSEKSSALVAGLVFYPLIALLGIVKTVATHGLSASELLQRRRVYNLQVEDSPEYFANGILVHNCVLMIAIGLQCIEFATTFHERVIERPLPRDLQRLMESNQQAPGTFA